MDIKQLKNQILSLSFNQPEKFFPVKTLKERDYRRKKCSCGRFFWTQQNDNKCDDCVPYSFVGKRQTKEKYDYINTAKRFSKAFDKLGYTATDRYPIVARWRPDITFVHAAINNYQPYVVSGEVEPPANPLNVLQPSLRFNDIENVGITGRHFVCHVHAEQFGVFPKKDYDKNKFLLDLIRVLDKGLSLPIEKLKFHEDAWGGGGNLGVSLEHFLGGIELGNQVYMTEKVVDSKYEPLSVGVLDMGAGLERYAMMASNNPSIYDVTMPTVCSYLYKETGIEFDKDLLKRFAPYGGSLNLDEVDSITRAWQNVAKKIGVDVSELKEKIKPLAAINFIADCTRGLLFAINDGALPSNTGGNYNLRFIFRRALGFMNKYNWNFDLNKLFELHASYLKPIYKLENVADVNEIIKYEEGKYYQSLENARKKVKSILSKQTKFTARQLQTLYESDGITPEMIEKVNPDVKIPTDFYSRIAEKKETVKAQKKKEDYNTTGLPDTEILFYKKPLEFDAKVLKVIKQKGKIYVILDRTAFYPESGGQSFDTGLLDNIRVTNVFKQKKVILHELEKEVSGKVHGKVNKLRRDQLMKHHTGTHIINGAARKVLGNHIWQAGAEKTIHKARLDITHYKNITDEELFEIEKLSNSAIKKEIPVEKYVMDKADAEKRFGFRLYQGGAVPGNQIRVIDIKNFDVEACGGTHFNNTKYVEEIKILGATKIQDGVVRIEFVAGKERITDVQKELQKKDNLEKQRWAKKITDLDNQIDKLNGKKVMLGLLPETIEEYFKVWKKAVKKLQKLQNESISDDPIQFIETPDMKLLQQVAKSAVKKHKYCFLVAPGMIYSYGDKTKKAAEKAAEIMGGKVGQKGKEFKGGGRFTDKSKDAFEKAKKLL